MTLKLPKLKLKINPKRISIFVLLLMMISAGFFYFLKVREAGATWWDSDWFFRRSIVVTNSSGGTLVDFQTKILSNYDLSNEISSQKIQSDLDDLRFASSRGEIFDYWIEDATATSVDIWLKIPNIETTGITVYMYYGNSQALAFSDGNKVFDFFDEFDVFDEAKWSATGAQSVTDGKLTITTGAVYSNRTVSDTPQNRTVEMKAKYLSTASASYDYSGINISEVQGTSISNNNADAVAYSLTATGGGNQLQAHASDGVTSGYNIAANADIYNQTLNTDYIIGYTFIGSTNIHYFVKNLNYSDLGTSTPNGTWNKPFYLWLGYYQGSNSVDRNLDDIEVDWVRVRKYATTEPTPGLPGPEERSPAPALYLPFDEGFGTTAHDESSNRNDGTIVGATWKDESECKSGKCLEFDGNGDYVEVADTSSLDLDNEFTLEAWIKPQSTTLNNQTILSKTKTPNEPTKIFRSVAPGATTALAVGTTNSMSIVGERAIFQTALPDNVGVGDAIQYDDDNDSDIDANDSIVFIKSRVSNIEYLIATASGTVPVQINNDNNWSLFRAYTSLANAEKGVENTGIDSDLRNFDNWTAGGDATTDDVGKDIVTSNEQWNIACYANGATSDGTDVEINGWTTGAQSSIKIYTPVNANEVGVSQRHQGKWDNNFYNITTTSYRGIYTYEEYIKIEGLQIFLTPPNSIQTPRIIRSLINSTNSAIYLSNNILKADYTILETGYYGHGFVNESSAQGNYYFFNNIFYNITSPSGDASYALIINGGSAKIYNNTFYNSDIGIYRYDGAVIAKNNIVQNCTIGYSGTFDAFSSNNISSDATATGTNSKINTTVSFIATTTGSEDFHLSPTDTSAKDAGADLSSDNTFPIATDIDGQSRLINSDNTKFDIGADEAQATKIFRSVAPGKTDALENGEENSLSIVGNSATFQRALADNVGVGDVIQYDDDNDGDIDASDSLAFIVERISSFEYIVTTASGGVPTSVSSDKDWSLFRAYSSLANAESGIENTGIDSDLRNFDTWSNGKDLVASKEQWNIACYENGAILETTGVSIIGWTTGIQNFIKIYTPTKENEVGISQRHNGTWGTGYRLDNVVLHGHNQAYIKLEGISLKKDTDGQYAYYFYGESTTGKIEVSDCFGWNTVGSNTSNGSHVFEIFSVSSTEVVLKNNIFINDSPSGYIVSTYDEDVVLNAFNNTFIGASGGLNINGGTDFYSRNNIIKYNSGSITGIIDTNSSNNLISFNISNGAFGVSADSGTTTATTASKLVDSTQNFATTVKVGMIIKNTTDNTYTYVTAIDSNTQLSVANNIFVSGEVYTIYTNKYGSATFLDEANDDYHLSPADTVARNAGIDLSNDSYLPFNTDIDGNERIASSTSWDIGADDIEATKIFRSVGPGNTTALALDNNHENTVSVTDGVATFEELLPNRIGVGDAVLIDTNSDNAITSADTLLFIHGRNSSNSYDLRTHTGAMPGDIGSNDTYQIYRAYISLNNAELGTKNTAIPIAFNGGNRDLVSNNEEWNIACYADGVDTTGAAVNGWITGPENFIKIYTPISANEVGESQRHNGVWGNGYRITDGISLNDGHIHLDGLSMRTTVAGGGYFVYQVEDGGEIFITNCFGWNASDYNVSIFYMTGNLGDITFKVWNNIAINNGLGGAGIRLGGDIRAKMYVYNNTIVANNYAGFVFGTGESYIFNNIVYSYGSGSGIYRNVGEQVYLLLNNATSDDTADNNGGSGNKVNQTFSFRDAANNDFRLAMTDTSAKGAGLNLTLDPNQPVTSDIEGEQRPGLDYGGGNAPRRVPTMFDIGADQISNTIHNNYSLNINSNYPSTTYSTSQSDNERYSSGDINLEANTWSHIVYKRNADTEELYINGAKKDSKTISDFVKTNNGKLYIGAENSNSKNSFKGLLDEIRIYNYPRTDDEIKKDTTQGSSGKAASRASEGVSVAIGDKAATISDGLVGYWKMDESSWNGTAQEVKDASGNSNHGVASGGASTTAGRFGYGGGFDGVDDYINLGSNVGYEGANAVSVSMWFKCNSVQAASNEIMLGQRAGGPTNTMVLQRGGYPYERINFAVTTEEDTASGGGVGAEINDVNWHHAVGVYDGEKVKLYIDGEVVGSEEELSGLVNTVSTDLAIGSNGTPAQSNFPGSIDETRIYNRALSPDEVKQLYNYAPGPVLHLNMDEKSGTTTFDSSGYNNHGTFNNGLVWENGKIGGSLNFSGSSVDVSVPTSASTESLDYSITVSGWVKGVNNMVNDTIISNYHGFGSGYFIVMYNSDGTISVGINISGSTNLDSVVNMNDDKWHYFSYIRNTADLKHYLYIDGVLNDSAVLSGQELITWETSPIIIGNGFGYYEGSIDDVKIYNYARTPEQILEDMRGTSGATLGGGAGALGSPILEFSFDEGQGGVVYDKSLYKNNGTLVSGATGGNSTTSAMWDKSGKLGGAMEFDGLNDRINLGNVPALNNMSSEITVSAWYYPRADGKDHWIFSRSGIGITSGIHLWADDDCATGVQGMGNIDTFSFNIGKSNDAGNRVNGPSGMRTLNQWHHVVGVMSGTSRKLYHNGELVASHNSGVMATVATTTDLSYLGYAELSVDYSDGLVDEFKIFNYALGDDDIKTLYNNSATMVMGGDDSRNNNGTSVTGANKEYCVPGDTAKCDKPVLELKMDEKVGSTTYDTSGNGNDGLFIGFPRWGRGKDGSGVRFDGRTGEANGSTINLGQKNSLTGMSALTFSTWVYPEENKTEADMLHNEQRYEFAIMNGNFSGAIGTQWEWKTGPNVSINQWSYLSGVWDGDKLHLYLNGVLKNTFDLTNGPIPSGFAQLDNIHAGNNIGLGQDLGFPGLMDELRIYNYARTPAQIAWDYNRGKPVLEWSFNEGSGVIAHNEIENINHGTISGATWKNESECKYGKCLSFDGINNYVGFTSTGADNYPISFSVWVKPNTLAQNGIVLSFDGTNVNQSFGIYSDTDKLLISNDNYGINGIGNYLTAQRWQLWTLVFEDASTYSFYLDGTEIPLVDVTDRYDVNGNNIGARANGTQRQFNGSIDEVKIFNYALTEEQIKIDYNGGAVNFR